MQVLKVRRHHCNIRLAIDLHKMCTNHCYYNYNFIYLFNKKTNNRKHIF